MATGKTSTLTFRIEPGLKEALRTAAERKDLIRDYCGRNGATIPEQGTLFDDNRKTEKNRK